MDDYENADFDVIESSSLNDKKVLATVCNIKEKEEAEDEEFTEKDGEEAPKKPSISNVANFFSKDDSI